MTSLADVEALHPEWRPWLALVSETLDEARADGWDAGIPTPPSTRAPGTPLLAGAALRPNGRLAPFFARMLKRAATSDVPAMARLGALLPCGELAHAALRAAVNTDERALHDLASRSGAETAAFRAVAMLLPMPLLHACARRWQAVLPQGWTQGYCPCCGAWPALAEVCGIERKRLLRCGRCGTGWEAACLCCPYCGTTDHGQLGTLMPDEPGAKQAIEVCGRCRGYLKTLTVLSAAPHAEVLLTDLATVELDLAAAARDYGRPQGAGYRLDLAA